MANQSAKPSLTIDQCGATQCETCAVHEFCVTSGNQQLDAVHRPVQRLYMPQSTAGANVFWAGDEFKYLYAVKSGCIKTFTVDPDGNEHVRGFYLPGDLVGVDAIYAGRHPSNATAVVPSNLCALPYNQLTRAAGNKPELQMRLMRHISQDLSTALSLGGDFTADQRLAAFFLHLQERELQRRMVTSDRIDLVMSRRDIASYLRLAPETVSRIIKRFTNAGWIQSKPRALFILDHTAMTQLAEPVGILNHPATSLAAAA